VKQISYSSADTGVSFRIFHTEYYFLEVNTRLQVEHGITELITGVDIVGIMIDVSMGKSYLLQMTRSTTWKRLNCQRELRLSPA
jgi:acetyl/propionyl-CoA carboxylase alpha subunit